MLKLRLFFVFALGFGADQGEDVVALSLLFPTQGSKSKSFLCMWILHLLAPGNKGDETSVLNSWISGHQML